MSADHLNLDLFGNVARPTPQETPVQVRPRTHVLAYHASSSPVPPHTQDHPDLHLLELGSSPFSSNQSNDVIHLGTLGAARTRAGRSSWHHVYKVPKTMLDEVHMDSDSAYSFNPQDNENIHGPQQRSLWETTVKPVEDVGRGNKVVPYLNQFEDKGSVSYMLPKHLVNPDQVDYLGLRNKDVETGPWGRD
jgi:hypothetical protein